MARTSAVLLLAWILGAAAPGAETKLVNLNVVALDSHAQPVTDLTSEDLHVVDAGKVQKLVFFRHNDSRQHEMTPLGSNEFSNRAGANVGRATLILFDLLNEHFGTRGNAWSELIHDLQPLESSDDLYLYLLTLEGSLYPVHMLPNPEGDAPQRTGKPWTQQIKTLLDEAMRVVSRARPVEIDVDTRVQMTYSALGTLAQHLSAIPGRKNIVWITHGIPISIGPQRTYTGDWIDYTPQLRRLSLTLDLCNVAIYPVQQVPPGMALPGTPEAQYSGLGSEETLQQFADLTGGRATAGSNISAAIRQAMTDVRTSYQIGYAPPARNWDGKFHKLRVTCGRKGVHIQTKTGYYAWAEVNQRPAALDAAVSSSFDTGEIGLRAGLSAGSNDAHAVRFQVRIDPADILLLREGDRYTGHLALAVVAYLAGGGTQMSPVVPLDLSLTQDEREKLMKEGIGFARELPLSGKVEKLRFVVVDRGSDSIGSLTVPVKPPG